MDTEKIKTLEQVVDAVTSKETTIDFDIYPQNRLQRWLQKKGWKPSKKKYVMRPIVSGNILRISRLLLSIEMDHDTLKKGFSIETFHQIARDHTETMIEVLAIGIHNQRSEPSVQLKEDIRWNLNASDMFRLLVVLLQQMNPTVFIQSIILMRGLNGLEKSGKKNEPNEVSPSIQER